MIASSFAALAQTSIAGVAFGSDYTSAKNILENKYGQQKWDSDKNSIHFENKEYGGIYFNDLFLISNIRVQEDILISAFL